MQFVESASEILAISERKLEAVAQNISNVATAGYKSRQIFETLLSKSREADSKVLADQVKTTFLAGSIRESSNPYDLALGGPGFFVVRKAGSTFYTRSGQFERDAQGHLVTTNGFFLQSTSGDIVLRGTKFAINSDGLVFDDDEPVGHIAVVDFADKSLLSPAGPSLFRALDGSGEEVPMPSVRQGALEMSNTSLSQEMLSLMAAMRQAETGQRLFQLYDDLLGRAVTSFGQG